MNFIEENPWTSGLTILGIIIAEVVLPSPMQNFLLSFSSSNITQDPANALTGFVIGYPIAILGEMTIRMISGLIGGLIGAVTGLFLDGRNKNGGYF